MRSWTWNDYMEAMFVPHGKWKCLAMKTWVLWFYMCNYGQANDSCMTRDHGNPGGCHYPWCLWATIMWVPTTPTSRTLSLTCSVGARLSDLWVMLWQMWLQFHSGGVANYRYFLHNRKCRPCGLHARSPCSQWTSSLPVERSAWWQRCCFLWLPLCAECSSI